MTDRRDYALGARNIKVFTTQSELIGLPSSVVFIGGLMVSVFFFVVFWWAGLLLAMIYFPFMYLIHREDPRGFDVIRAALKERYSYWGAGSSGKRSIRFIDRQSATN